MGTSLKNVMDMMMPLIPDDYKTDIAEDIDLAKRGVIEMGVALKQEYMFTSVVSGDGTVTDVTINIDLSMFETFLASHYAYRAYLMRLKDELNRDAINFKTLTFEIKSLEKRPTAINDSLYSLNRYLADTVAMVTGSNSTAAVVTQFGSTK